MAKSPGFSRADFSLISFFHCLPNSFTTTWSFAVCRLDGCYYLLETHQLVPLEWLGFWLRVSLKCIGAIKEAEHWDLCRQKSFWLSRHAEYEWGDENKHGLEGAWAELQNWALQRDGSKGWSSLAADLGSGLSVSRIILSWWDLLPENKGGLVFSQVSQVLTFHLANIWPFCYLQQGDSFHHRRTGGSEYWEKGRLLHDFAYWLLAKNGRCAYWMQRSFYSHIQVSPSLSSLAEYQECTILHAIHVSSFPLPPMFVHFLTFMLFISLFYTV